jgi:hypothetical protein
VFKDPMKQVHPRRNNLRSEEAAERATTDPSRQRMTLMPHSGKHFRQTSKEKAMFTNGKIAALSAAVILIIAFAIPSSVAFANAPGGAYIQCNGGPSSPVRCTPDGW